MSASLFATCAASASLSEAVLEVELLELLPSVGAALLPLLLAAFVFAFAAALLVFGFLAAAPSPASSFFFRRAAASASFLRLWRSLACCSLSSVWNQSSSSSSFFFCSCAQWLSDGAPKLRKRLSWNFFLPLPFQPVHRDVIRREVYRVGFDQRNPKPETDC